MTAISANPAPAPIPGGSIPLREDRSGGQYIVDSALAGGKLLGMVYGGLGLVGGAIMGASSGSVAAAAGGAVGGALLLGMAGGLAGLWTGGVTGGVIALSDPKEGDNLKARGALSGAAANTGLGIFGALVSGKPQGIAMAPVNALVGAGIGYYIGSQLEKN